MTPLYIVIAIAAVLLIYRMFPTPEKIKKVMNQNRKFGASDEYYHVRVGGKDYLFTSKEMINASLRAQKNPEDIN